MSILILMAALLPAVAAAYLAALAYLERRDGALRKQRMLGRLGARAPAEQRSIRLPLLHQAALRRRKQLERRRFCAELPRMLEVVALGMRTGLGFDQAFALYALRFDTALAKVCAERYALWEHGLILREQGLRQLAERIDLALFTRFVQTAIRSMNYGAPMTELLYGLADETRKAYRAEQQELVAKAPVKMLIPTGALILPAMLLLVIGPILMDLIGRMS